MYLLLFTKLYCKQLSLTIALIDMNQSIAGGPHALSSMKYILAPVLSLKVLIGFM